MSDLALPRHMAWLDVSVIREIHQHFKLLEIIWLDDSYLLVRHSYVTCAVDLYTLLL